MADGYFFNSEADKIMDCAKQLSQSIDAAGFSWKDRKFMELCNSVREITAYGDGLRSAAESCKMSYDAFWNIARRQV